MLAYAQGSGGPHGGQATGPLGWVSACLAADHSLVEANEEVARGRYPGSRSRPVGQERPVLASTEADADLCPPELFLHVRPLMACAGLTRQVRTDQRSSALGWDLAAFARLVIPTIPSRDSISPAPLPQRSRLVTPSHPSRKG